MKPNSISQVGSRISSVSRRGASNDEPSASSSVVPSSYFSFGGGGRTGEDSSGIEGILNSIHTAVIAINSDLQLGFVKISQQLDDFYMMIAPAAQKWAVSVFDKDQLPRGRNQLSLGPGDSQSDISEVDGRNKQPSNNKFLDSILDSTNTIADTLTHISLLVDSIGRQQHIHLELSKESNKNEDNQTGSGGIEDEKKERREKSFFAGILSFLKRDKKGGPDKDGKDKGGIFGKLTTGLLLLGKSVLSAILAPLKLILGVFKKGYKIITAPLMKIFGMIGKVSKGLFGIVGGVLGRLGMFISVFGKLFLPLGAIYVGLKGILASITALAKGGSGIDAIKAFLTEIVNFFTFGLVDGKKLVDKMWNLGERAFNAIYDFGLKLWDWIKRDIIPPLQRFWDGVKRFFENHIVPLMQSIWAFIEAKIIPMIVTAWEAIQGWLIDISNWLTSLVSEYMPGITAALSTMVDSITAFFNWMAAATWADIFDLGKLMILRGVKGLLSSVISAIMNTFQFIGNVFFTITETIQNSFRSFLTKLIDFFIDPDGITGGLNRKLKEMMNVRKAVVSNSRATFNEKMNSANDRQSEDFSKLFGGFASGLGVDNPNNLGIDELIGELSSNMLAASKKQTEKEMADSQTKSSPTINQTTINAPSNTTNHGGSTQMIVPSTTRQNDSTFTRWGNMLQGSGF